MYRACRCLERIYLVLIRGDTFYVVVSHMVELQKHFEELCLVRPVSVGYADVLAPAMQKAVQVLDLRAGTSLHFLGPVSGDFVMDGIDGLIGIEIEGILR